MVQYLRRVLRFACFDSAYRSTTSNMHGDQVRPFNRLYQECRDGMKNERVADAMKPVLLKSPLIGNVQVNRVCFHLFRNCMMEGGVKIRDTFDIREFLSARPNNLQGRVIVSIKNGTSPVSLIHFFSTHAKTSDGERESTRETDHTAELDGPRSSSNHTSCRL